MTNRTPADVWREERRPYYNRYGERAEYNNDEPRYSESRERFRGLTVDDAVLYTT